MSAPCPAITSRTTRRRLAARVFCEGYLLKRAWGGNVGKYPTECIVVSSNSKCLALHIAFLQNGSLFGSRMLHPFGCDDVKLPQKNRGGKACGGNEVPRVYHVVLDCPSRPRQSTWLQLMMASLHWSSSKSLSAVLLGIVSSPSSASSVVPAIRLQTSPSPWSVSRHSLLDWRCRQPCTCLELLIWSRSTWSLISWRVLVTARCVSPEDLDAAWEELTGGALQHWRRSLGRVSQVPHKFPQRGRHAPRTPVSREARRERWKAPSAPGCGSLLFFFHLARALWACRPPFRWGSWRRFRSAKLVRRTCAFLQSEPWLPAPAWWSWDTFHILRRYPFVEKGLNLERRVGQTRGPNGAGVTKWPRCQEELRA